MINAAPVIGPYLILIAVGIGIALAIMYFHINELKAWMAGRLFGVKEAERYDRLD